MKTQATKEGLTPAAPDSLPAHINWKGGHLHLPTGSRLTSPASVDRQPRTRSTVFLDRDGVLVEDVHFLREPSQLRILSGVPGALRALQGRFYIVVATNQSGIARGLFTENDLLVIHSEMVNLLSAEGVTVDALYYCPHLPEASLADYRMDCDCRKPRPGMLLRAQDQWDIDLASSYMIGDQPRDVEAGVQAGVKSIMLETPAVPPYKETYLAANLSAAADFILADRQVTSAAH